MILFFAEGSIDSDIYIKQCYGHFVTLMKENGKEYPRDVEIIREHGKKPFFSHGGAHFSLSHSHGVMMLAISHAQVGADIQKTVPVDINKFSFIEAKDEEEFYKEWTKRESYVKMTGKGLSQIREDIPEDTHFEHFEVFDGYLACVCAEEQSVIAYQMDLNALMEDHLAQTDV